MFAPNNQPVGTLDVLVNPQSQPGQVDWIVPGKEIVVVPVPGACSRYYLFYTLSGNFTTVLANAIIDCSGPSPTIWQNTKRVGTRTYETAPGLAASKPKPDKSRVLYVAGGTLVTSFNLSTGGGISTETTLNPGSAFGGSCEAELSPDGKYLAWAPTNGQQVKLYNLDPSSGTNLLFSFTPILTFGSVGTITGLEFSSTSNKLFIIGSSGGGVYDIASQQPSPIPVSADTLSGGAQIEMGFDGLLYTTRAITRALFVNGVKTRVTKFRLATINPATLAVNASPLIFYPTRLNSLGGAQAPGFAFPDQIDGEDYAEYFGNSAPHVTTLAVDNSPLGYGSFRNVYSCNPLTLTANVSANATQVTVKTTAVDGNGNPTGAYSYSYNTPALPLDLKPLNGNYLATHPGTYRVEVTVTTPCGQTKTTSGLMQVSYLTTASAGFAFPLCNGGLTQAASTSVGSPASLGVYSNGSINIQFSTGTFDDYQVRFEKYVNGQFQAVGNIAYLPNPMASGNPPTLYMTYLAGETGLKTDYFQQGQLGFGVLHRIILSVSNECGVSAPLMGYFITDDYNCRPAPTSGTGPVAQQAPLYPNPLSGVETGHLRFTLPTAQPVSLTLVDALTGQVRLTVLRQSVRPAGEQEVSFQTGQLPAGVYLYRLTTAEGTTTGRLHKTE